MTTGTENDSLPHKTTVQPKRGKTFDEIDFVDIVVFVLKKRWWMLAGASAGLLGSLFLTFFVLTENFNTQLSVTIDPDSLPAVTKTDTVVNMYRSALANPEYAIEALNTLTNALKDPARAKEAASDLIARQTASRTLAGRPPLHIERGAADGVFLVRLQLPYQAFGADALKILVDAFSNLAGKYNSTLLTQRAKLFTTQVSERSNALDAAQHNDFLTKQGSVMGLTSTLSEVSRIEYDLRRRLPASLLATLHSPTFVEAADQRGGPGSDQRALSFHIDEVLRLNSFARAAGTLDAQASAENEKRLASLRLAATEFGARYLSHQMVSTEMARRLAEAQQRLLAPVTRELEFMPKLRANPELVGEFAQRGRFEVSDRRIGLMVFVGVFLGTTGGFFAGIFFSLIALFERRWKEMR